MIPPYSGVFRRCVAPDVDRERAVQVYKEGKILDHARETEERDVVTAYLRLEFHKGAFSGRGVGAHPAPVVGVEAS